MHRLIQPSYLGAGAGHAQPSATAPDQLSSNTWSSTWQQYSCPPQPAEVRIGGAVTARQHRRVNVVATRDPIQVLQESSLCWRTDTRLIRRNTGSTPWLWWQCPRLVIASMPTAGPRFAERLWFTTAAGRSTDTTLKTWQSQLIWQDD